MNIAVLLAGGNGTRMKKEERKQHIVVNGRQIVEYTLFAFSTSEQIDAILLVSNSQEIQECEKLKKKFEKLKWIIEGGSTRIESVYNAVVFLDSICGADSKCIISDAVRPCITQREIDELIMVLSRYEAATTGVEIYETIIRKDEERISDIINREGILRQTSPEGYRFSILKQLYLKTSKDIIVTYRNIGIDQLHEMGVEIGIVKSTPLNFKITTAKDLDLFEMTLKEDFRKIILEQ